MSLVRIALAVAIASATVIAAACGVDVDITNKSCPCGPDFACDSARNVCVTPQELAALDGSVDGGGEGGPVACPDDRCPCANDGACTDPTRKHCGPEKVCVECVREPADTCAPGNYCNDQNQCTLGCKQESDCQISPAVPHCKTTSHQCVECVNPGQCEADAGLLCSPSGTCVEGCNLDAGIGCSNGKTCCGAFCLNLANDVLNCGACDKACSKVNGTPSCAGSNCNWQCASGFGHCAAGNTGCETNLRTDVTKCGSCGRDCNNTVLNANGISCNVGNCGYASCKLGFGDCNGFPGDGCDCSCGSFAGEQCCPGLICTFVGGRCVGSNPPKCQ